MIDYRELLTKYMRHIGQCEGVTFLHDPWSDVKFTPEEMAELERIDEETIEKTP